jgi:hypothetical protein
MVKISLFFGKGLRGEIRPQNTVAIALQNNNPLRRGERYHQKVLAARKTDRGSSRVRDSGSDRGSSRARDRGSSRGSSREEAARLI